MTPLFTRLLVGSAAVATLLVASTSAAFAHVEISPDSVAPGTFTTYVLTVPNEEADDITTGIDVSLPVGFLLEAAQSVEGWRTVVDTRPDGTATAVHWRGGRLAPHTFGEFSLLGRIGKDPGPVIFAVEQHYTKQTVNWTGPPDSEVPAPTVTVRSRAAQAPGTSATSAAAHVPAAAPSTGSTDGEDPLARSRASLALVLALAALVLGGGFIALQRAKRIGG